MSRKKITIVITAFILLLISILFIINRSEAPNSSVVETMPTVSVLQSESPTPQDEIVDKQAAFAIFTNGTFRIFTADMYHNLSSDVYIEAENPNIVQVKKSGITWNDFFSTLPFELSKDCLVTGTKQTFCSGGSGVLRFFLNGEEVSDALNREIEDGDKLLVTFGSESSEVIQTQLDRIPDL